MCSTLGLGRLGPVRRSPRARPDAPHTTHRLAAGLLGTTSAHAAPVGTGLFTWSGDPGDGNGDDQARWYGTAQGDRFDVTASADHNSIRVTVGRSGDPWTAEFAAPGGQALAVGSYAEAVHFPAAPESGAPSMLVNGYRASCDSLTGGFWISALEFGADGKVKTFNARFEQDCDDRNVLTGSLSLSATATPTPAPLKTGVTVAGTGKALASNGKALLHGTVTCSKPTSVYVNGPVTQVTDTELLKGIIAVSVPCTPGKPVTWQSEAYLPWQPNSHFTKGRVRAELTTYADDPDTGQGVMGPTTVKVVTLSKG
ncbi:hypothetical protein [Streptomyces sp. NPDC060031]|uniref:hypothetical protein n=1 Tax=Streptomyces sp. NPDC060031 TaxID=3347043 RepID=UPI00369F2CBA